MRPFWDVHRQWIAPAVADRIDGALRPGRLVLHAGRISADPISNQLVSVDFLPRGGSRMQSLLAARVINCSGPALDLERSGEPLIGALIKNGITRPAALRLGPRGV